MEILTDEQKKILEFYFHFKKDIETSLKYLNEIGICEMSYSEVIKQLNNESF